MAFDRIDRVSEEVKRELAEIIRELKDPRIPEITTVVAVEVTKDLKFAKAHISVMGNEQQQNDAISGLKSAAGFIRHEIGVRIQLRHVPEFSFKLDHSMEHGDYINRLLHNLDKHDGKE